ncbi:MAG: vitamin K epoxide reductase family protein [Pirellulales bacterium]
MTDPQKSTVSVPKIALTLLLTGGLVLSGYLTFSSMNDVQLAGCGLESGCHEVLSSDWSRWFGLPVAMLAFWLYLTTLLLIAAQQLDIPEETKKVATQLVTILITIAAVSAVWFIGLQIFILQQFCWYCLIAHACALASCILVWQIERPELRPALRAVVASVFVTVFLVIGQVAFEPEEPRGMELVIKDPNLQAYLMMDPLATEDERPGRLVTLASGVLEIDTHAWPILGSPDAEEVIIELLDYRCEYCREMSHVVDELRQKYPDKIAVLTLPFPLNPDCNPYVDEIDPGHEDSCYLAGLSIAVWRYNPKEFEAFHHWLFEAKSLRSAEEAENYLIEKLGQAALEIMTADESTFLYIDRIVDIVDTGLIDNIPAIFTKNHSRQGITNSLDQILPTIAADHNLSRP